MVERILGQSIEEEAIDQTEVVGLCANFFLGLEGWAKGYLSSPKIDRAKFLREAREVAEVAFASSGLLSAVSARRSVPRSEREAEARRRGIESLPRLRELRAGRFFPDASGIDQTDAWIKDLVDQFGTEVVTWKLKDVRHDLINPLKFLFELSERGNRAFLDRKRVVSELSRIAETVELGRLYLENNYSHEVIDLFAIKVALLNSSMSRDHYQADIDSVPYDVKIDYSYLWLSRLVGNIFQNLDRAFVVSRDEVRRAMVPFASVSWSEVSDGGQKFWEMMVEDRGPGFDEAILRSGFQRSLSTWGGRSNVGEGIGMADLKEVLEREYGGRMILENRKEGGARLRVWFRAA